MLPVVFVSHGAPTLAVDVGDPTHAFLSALGRELPLPRAIIVISAHWEDDVFAVTGAERLSTIHDFSGFPAELYDIRYEPPGDPALAARIAGLIAGAGLPSRVDPARGLDHGAWVPLMLAYPAADIPVVQVSLRRGLDAAQHIALGRALAPLRKDHLIIASGSAVHNLRMLDWAAMGQPAQDAASAPWAAAFEDWLRETMALSGVPRQSRLAEWESAPEARRAHAREEHLIPLHVAAGAGGDEPAALVHQSWQMGNLSLSAWRLGK
ncbi:MAG: dioxygenase [Planctomycetes bacterium]|nr:dioxygenase [Planctomycetota bacterium]MCW8136063.1 dioxygenase [Planctomycetota bacterium]